MTPSSPAVKIRLASKSSRRHTILRDLGIPFEVVSSNYEEDMAEVRGRDPAEQAAHLALRKAREAELPPRAEGFVIGADTIVVCENCVLGKPTDRTDARRMLTLLEGRSHEVMTGLALISPADGVFHTHTERTVVHFRSLSSAELDWYLDSPEPYDKAGAYAIQGRASFFVDRIEGCYFNVVGFPVVALLNLFQRFSVNLFDLVPGGKKE